MNLTLVFRSQLRLFETSNHNEKYIVKLRYASSKIVFENQRKHLIAREKYENFRFPSASRKFRKKNENYAKKHENFVKKCENFAKRMEIMQKKEKYRFFKNKCKIKTFIKVKEEKFFI